MASAEQNALFLMQLFNNATGPTIQRFDEMRQEKLRLAERMRAEEEARVRTLQTQGFQRELETGRDSRARDLAKELNAARIEEEKVKAEGANKLYDTRAKEAERRQGDALDAAERKQILAEMNRLYPQYAAAAATAGVEIKQRNEFPETNEGLGQLAADYQTVKAGYGERQKKAAATSIIGGLDEAVAAVDEVKNRIDALSRPQPDEQKQARSMAVKALETSLAKKELASAEKLGQKAISDGLAALRRGEDAVARKLLGDEAIAAFESANGQVLFSLPNRRAAIEEQKRLNQQLLLLQSHAARVGSDVTKAAAANLYLADELSTRRSPLQKIMTPPPAAGAPTIGNVMGTLRPPPPPVEAPGAPAPQTAAPSESASRPSPNLYSMMGGGMMPAAPQPSQPQQPVTRMSARDAISDTMRATGYGVSNLFRPSSWRGPTSADEGVANYRPEEGALLGQLQSRLAALDDPDSPTAQELRTLIQQLSGQPQTSPLLNLQTGTVLTPPLSFGQGGGDSVFGR